MLSLCFRLAATLPRLPTRFAPAIAGLSILGGCATGNYPSLEHRAAETGMRPGAPVAAPSVLSPPAANLPTTLDALLAKARKGHLLFTSLQPRGESAVAASANAAPDGEAAAMANLALAELESARSDVAVVLADLDRLYTDDRLAHSLEGDTPPLRPARTAIAAAQAEVRDLIRHEDELLARLNRRAGG